MKERIRQLFEESIAARSFTNSAREQEAEQFLMEKISSIPYFKENPDFFGEKKLGDFYDRSNIWALKKGTGKETVIFFHHHDVVDTTDYGKYEEIAFDNEKIKKTYLAEPDIPQHVKDDAASGEWYFARGSADMKAALALQLGVFEEYCKKDNPKINLLYLSVADEESYSTGMRAAPTLLKEIKDKFDLEYTLAIDSEPFEGDKAGEKILHIGTVGKLMPIVVAQGVLAHIKEPLEGINAVSLMSKISEKLDLRPELADKSKGEQSPLPSWGFMRDRKEVYDASTVLRAAGYFSILYLEKSPEDLLEKVREISKEATDEYYEKLLTLQKQFDVKATLKRPRVMLYDELVAECEKLDGFDKKLEEINAQALEHLKGGETFQNVTIQCVEEMLEFYGKKEAIIVIAMAPPYYPALSSSRIEKKGVIIPKLKAHYENYLKEKGFNLKTEEYFMGICDISYCGLDKPVDVHKAVLRKTAVDKSVYDIDFDSIADVNVPAVNLGPWGKDLHRYTERVLEKDSFELIPDYLLYLMEDIESIL